MLNKIKKFISRPKEFYPNIEIFTYHLLKAIKKLLQKFRLIKPQKLNRDMFDWPLYFLHYRGELKVDKKKYIRTLKSGDYLFENNFLAKKNDNIKPLHHSHRFIYETILQLNAKSIFEMGCGDGVNLYNLKTLSPTSRICGTDLSIQQLKNLKKLYPNIINSVKQIDATISNEKLPFKICELAFTQAVIMHIHTEKLYYEALINLFKMASKYVLLMESNRTHKYIDYIKELQREKKIPWESIYFHYRIDPITNNPLSIICSKQKLSYPEYS